ncbi:hypothetical protein HAX54_027943 [Datura stramonium]|uniref:Uncharacterized protein n=1 Tax=Datura stramonium TaxID=4076 RepID=A0ABS8V3J4_DATST|nr:hypothetical protein [Datura stramonium]
MRQQPSPIHLPSTTASLELAQREKQPLEKLSPVIKGISSQPMTVNLLSSEKLQGCDDPFLSPQLIWEEMWYTWMPFPMKAVGERVVEVDVSQSISNPGSKAQPEPIPNGYGVYKVSHTVFDILKQFVMLAALVIVVAEAFKPGGVGAPTSTKNPTTGLPKPFQAHSTLNRHFVRSGDLFKSDSDRTTPAQSAARGGEQRWAITEDTCDGAFSADPGRDAGEIRNSAITAAKGLGCSAAA